MDSVDSRGGDVQSVHFRVFGKWNLFDQFIGQVFGRVGDIENGDVADCPKAFLGRLRITRTTFGDDRLRDIQAVLPAMIVPPITCELLIRGGNQITTRPRRKIADDAGFEVNGGVHGH